MLMHPQQGPVAAKRLGASSGEITSLTGLRGIAACLVMVYHFVQDGMFSTETLHGPARVFMLHGYLAVDLFFVLSGFVMALSYSRTFQAGYGLRDYGGFLYKRLARVYPVYLVATAATLALAHIGAARQVSATPAMLLWNLLMIQGWGSGGAQSFVAAAWSISTEFGAYLLFPALLAAATGRRPWGWITAAAAVAALVAIASTSPAQVHEVVNGVSFRTGPLDVYNAGDTLYPLLRCLAGFSLGLVAYRVSSADAVRRLAGWRYAGDLALAGVLVVMAVPFSDVLVVLLFAPLVVTLATGRSLTARVLGRGTAYWLGVVSYSIYLVHNGVEEALFGPIQARLAALHVPHAYSLGFACVIALVIACSAATYYGIERPAQRWARRAAGFGRPAEGSAAGI